MFRTIVRSILPLKNFISNLELLYKVHRGYPIVYENDDPSLGYYAIIHVRYGHIPYPLIWKRISEQIAETGTYAGPRYYCEELRAHMSFRPVEETGVDICDHGFPLLSCLSLYRECLYCKGLFSPEEIILWGGMTICPWCFDKHKDENI